MSKLGVFGSAHSVSDRYRRRLLSAAGLSNNLLFSNLNTTITVKSTPSKDASTTSELGVLDGYLTKRNEQHAWQRRFCVLVPQLFLYYFEGSDGDSPRGIIDLEAYTDITAQPDNVVRLATAPGREPQRTFYFQADSEEDCQAWISALIRERYFKLRDERDAYQELQGDFQAQTAHAQDLMAQATEEAEAAEASFADEARQEAEFMERLRALLAELGEYQVDDDDGEAEAGEDSSSDGESDDETPAALERRAALRRLRRAGRSLLRKCAALEAELESSEAAAHENAREDREHAERIAALEAELRREEETIAEETRLKEACEAEALDLQREIDEAEMNRIRGRAEIRPVGSLGRALSRKRTPFRCCQK